MEVERERQEEEDEQEQIESDLPDEPLPYSIETEGKYGNECWCKRINVD